MDTLALDYCFFKLGLHKLGCKIVALNTPVVSLHRKFGFVEESFFKEPRLIGSEFVDVDRLAIASCRWKTLKSDFISPIDPEATE